MTDEAQDTPGEAGAEASAPMPARRSRRRLRRVVKAIEIIGILILAPIVFLVIAIWAATDNRVRLPQAVEAQIASRLDRAMQENEIRVQEIAIALPRGQFTPEVVLRGMQLRDEQGVRAYFPEVSVVLNGRALLDGQLRARRVRLDGAGVRLSRDSDGVIDIALATGDAASEEGITETLARIDAMFQEPAFSELEEISGSGLVLLLVDAVTGQIIQSQDAVMRLERKAEALTLLVQGSVSASRDARVEIAVTRNPGLGRNDMLLAFEGLAARDLATASPALAWLDLLRAPMAGRLVGVVSDAGVIGDMQGRLDIGAGALTPREGLDAIPLERLVLEMSFDAGAQSLRLDALDLASDALSLTATGQADILEDGQEIVGQLQLSQLRMAPPGLFDRELDFEGGALDIQVRLAPRLEVTVGQAVLFDGPLRIRASGRMTAEEAGLVTRVDAQIPTVDAAEVLPYWPEFAVPGARAWVMENLTTGTVRGFAAAFRAGPQGRSQALRFDFDGLTLHPLGDLPPIEDGAGYVDVQNDRFVLRLTEGRVEAPVGGTLSVAGSTMVIGDTRPRNPEARFDLAIDGPLQAVGAVLALPPVNLLAESALDPATLATGRLQGQIGLDLVFRRHIPRDEIRYEAAGTLSDVRAETLVPGRVLTARRLDLTVTPEEVAIAGRAAIDGVGLTGRWAQLLGVGLGSRAEGRLAVTAAAFDTFGIALPPGTIGGAGGADFTLDLPPGGPPALSLTSDLDGLSLSVPSLGVFVPEARTGRVTAEIVLEEVARIPSLTIATPGLDLDGSVSLTNSGGLEALRFDSLRLGGWADLSGSLLGRGAGAVPAVRLAGGTIDLRALPQLTDGAADGPPIDARLDRLTVTDGITLTGLSADLAPGLQGDFTGLVNGQVAVRGTLARGPQGLGVRVRSEDGGAVLRAAGVFDNGYGGQMDLTLDPTGETGSYRGQLDIDGARLRDAPAMAELLNAISVVGLLEQLDGAGINLGEIDAAFRITPQAIVLDEGTALGASMGISMDGYYLTASQQYEMQGVISPFYFVNGAFGALFAPRREGLFGVSYRLTGTPAGANVSVNPLSILTPGIFREIFRRPPPETLPSQ